MTSKMTLPVNQQIWVFRLWLVGSYFSDSISEITSAVAWGTLNHLIMLFFEIAR